MRETDWDYTSQSRRCRKNPEMTVPISYYELYSLYKLGRYSAKDRISVHGRASKMFLYMSKELDYDTNII